MCKFTLGNVRRGGTVVPGAGAGGRDLRLLAALLGGLPFPYVSSLALPLPPLGGGASEEPAMGLMYIAVLPE